MRLLLYNLRYGSGTGTRFHLPFPMAGYLLPTRRKFRPIIEFIRSCRPDVLCLVEVDHGSLLRCSRRSQVAALSHELGLWSHVRTKYRPGSLADTLPMLGKQANAILTRECPRSCAHHYLKRGMKRLVLSVELAEVRVFLVHLAIRRKVRDDQLRELAQLVRHAEGPVIVAGDFNIFDGDAELKPFLHATGLRNASPGGQPSWPSWAPRHQLDFILHSQELEVTGFKVPTVRFSDHYPVLCDFRFRGK